MTNLKIIGTENTIKSLEKIGEEKIAKISNAVLQSGFFLESEVKESIAGHRAETRSVDTGQFLNSVRTEKINALEVDVSSDVEQAKFMEWGTSKISPRRHFRNSAARNKEKIINYLNTQIKAT